ncbi:hypothetical protein DFH09DRAFT_1317136 [Mycena vulgaris]|nr:hypothetical protein DFH09DRAFT_1317136 [Mycena vulgaris]
MSRSPDPIYETQSSKFRVTGHSPFELNKMAEIRSLQTCGGSTDALPFYRLYDPTIIDHVYTTDLDVVNADVPTHTFQGVAALVFGTQEESTVPFYRLVNRATAVNFYTISETE